MTDLPGMFSQDGPVYSRKEWEHCPREFARGSSIRETLQPRPVKEDTFFRGLGQRVRRLRQRNGYSQEAMMSFGFSARHWQQIEAGRPITMITFLRICEIFEMRADELIRYLDRGIYDSKGTH
jgi:hypothetical protein